MNKWFQQKKAIYNICSNEKGQITVFLALLFLVLLGFSWAVMEGVQNYSSSYLAEDAVKSAGENIMANYNKELFKNYHVFFLDPREKEYILSDGKEYINQYFSGNSFFNIHCNSIEIVDEKTVVEENGLYLKHEIREWMKYREKKKRKDNIENIIKNVTGNDKDRQQCEKDVAEAEKKEQEVEKSLDADKVQEDTTDNIQEKAQETEEQPLSPEVIKERTTWKEIKEAIQTLMKTGVLFYAVENPENLSKQSISLDNLPSKSRGDILSFGKEELADKISDFSLLNIKEIKNLFSGNISVDNNVLFTKDNYIVPYIEEYFSCYQVGGQKKAGKQPSNKTKGEADSTGRALFYETEYLINGKSSDLENLKMVANQIMALRFMTNYVLSGKNVYLKAQIDTMAAAVSGFMGMPQAMKAVQVLIRVALSYGESLLELHTLLTGGKIPLIKSQSNWNLELSTMVSQLKEKKPVKKGKENISYQDFLKILLLLKGQSEGLCYRMMDIMQLNVAYKEPGFLMEKCLFSYKWKVDFSIGTINMNIERQNNY
nr:DUF5702 domain-containing protein [uncultured Anaerobutyricum sp.]